MRSGNSCVGPTNAARGNGVKTDASSDITQRLLTFFTFLLNIFRIQVKCDPCHTDEFGINNQTYRSVAFSRLRRVG